MQFKVEEVANIIGGTVEGDGQRFLSSFGKIETAQEGDLTFLANLKYEPYIYKTEATAVLVSNDFTAEKPIGAALIRVADPYEALALLMKMVQQQSEEKLVGIHPTAIIDDSVLMPDDCYVGAYAVIEEGVTIGSGCVIRAHCCIGAHATLGENCSLYPRVTIYPQVSIGNRAVIHAGAVIGSDGFGFAPTDEGYDKIPQMGTVAIGDDVEIGANTCIDRAVMGATEIGNGVKIDNLVQIAHNCKVDQHTVLAAQVGLSGSSHVEEWCQLGGQVGIVGHITIGAHTQMGGQCGALGDIPKNSRVTGSPAMPVVSAMRSFAVLKRLPEMERKLTKLEELVIKK